MTGVEPSLAAGDVWGSLQHWLELCRTPAGHRGQLSTGDVDKLPAWEYLGCPSAGTLCQQLGQMDSKEAPHLMWAGYSHFLHSITKPV